MTAGPVPPSAATDLLAAAPPASRRGARFAGWTILGALGLLALVGPHLVGDPARQDLAASLAPIGGDHVLGADHFGRSLVARLAHGARLSFGLALVTAASAAVPGVALGLIAAWRGGFVDRLLAGLADVVLALPGLLLVLVLLAFAPGHFAPLYLGLSLALWVEFFRVTRAAARPVLAADHVEAARLLGFGPLHVARRHVLPVVAPVVLTLAAFATATAVLAISTLSAIGVGLQPPTPELGSMTVELLPYYAEAPVHVLLPGLLVFLMVLGLQLVAGGREA